MGMAAWESSSFRRNGSYTTHRSYQTYIETRSVEVVANILICLIHQTNYLLDQLLRKLEKTFLQEGGLRERMTRARLMSGQGRKAAEAGSVAVFPREIFFALSNIVRCS
jgi:four helix bundle suffix protein